MNTGYKVTDSNGKCRGFQYEVGKTYAHNGNISLCNSGFHFCLQANDCFNYYSFDSTNRVFEVGYGEKVEHGSHKSVTDTITFIRELTWTEVLVLVNIGKNNTGRANSGNWNSGNRNSGDSNSGGRNSGDSNSGYRNSGNWNSGGRNSGDSNSGYRNSGAFCTDLNPTLILFNKPTNITIKEWENTEVVSLMYNIEPTIWIPFSMMSENEKAEHPKAETCEGYLKNIPIKDAWANFWGNLQDDKKALFTSLPNFDAAIFEEITGIKTQP